MRKYLLIGDGESPHLLKWAEELDKYFELYLVSSRGVATGIQHLIPEENRYEFNLNPKKKGGNFAYIRLIKPFRKIIASIAPDFVNAHYITSHGVLAALGGKPLKRTYKLILTAWGTDILVTPFRNPFYKAITRFALNRADLVTTDSREVAGIVHILSSTPTTTFPFGLNELPDVRVADKDPNLYFSNRTLNKNSNISRVIEFFAKIYSGNSQARLIIANEGPLKAQLVELSSSLGIDHAVSFKGFITHDEQQEIYRKALFYFSILTSDALSVSLLEAMASGCIPVVSDLPDNREWVEDKKNGVVLGPGTAVEELSALTASHAEIFEHNRKLIARKAYFPAAIEDYCKELDKMP